MRILVTGGAGFIGCNTARRLLERGDAVVTLDNLSRHPNQEANLRWLQEASGDLETVAGDIRDADLMRKLFDGEAFDAVIHMAAQTAVTTSVTDPRTDFEINALGTFNLLEAIRLTEQDPVVLNASTNKVYGGMEDVEIVGRDGRYVYRDLPDGVDETRQLDFHSPYGCSKGAADQYTIDYSRIYGLRTVSLRQSCIYGTRQFGMEDQGWVAWFTIAAVTGRPITIYGDWKQVRDVLWIDDLVDLYERSIASPDDCVGEAYNVGGGPQNTLSLLELVQTLSELSGEELSPAFGDWRPGDQRVFCCDVRKVEHDLGWRPETSPRQGIEALYRWVVDNRDLFAAG